MALERVHEVPTQLCFVCVLQLLDFWVKLLQGPLTTILQDTSSRCPKFCSATVDCLSNIGAQIFEILPVSCARCIPPYSKLHSLSCDPVFWPRWFVGNYDQEKPMILCARRTSRSKWTESTKRRSRSEGMRNLGSFYSQNNKIEWLSNIADTFLFEKCTGCAKVCGLFSWLCFMGADWLGRETLITWCSSKSDSWPVSASSPEAVPAW